MMLCCCSVVIVEYTWGTYNVLSWCDAMILCCNTMMLSCSMFLLWNVYDVLIIYIVDCDTMTLCCWNVVVMFDEVWYDDVALLDVCKHIVTIGCCYRCMYGEVLYSVGGLYWQDVVGLCPVVLYLCCCMLVLHAYINEGLCSIVGL